MIAHVSLAPVTGYSSQVRFAAYTSGSAYQERPASWTSTSDSKMLHTQDCVHTERRTR